jgi:hypothetical protein
VVLEHVLCGLTRPPVHWRQKNVKNTRQQVVAQTCKNVFFGRKCLKNVTVVAAFQSRKASRSSASTAALFTLRCSSYRYRLVVSTKLVLATAKSSATFDVVCNVGHL